MQHHDRRRIPWPVIAHMQLNAGNLGHVGRATQIELIKLRARPIRRPEPDRAGQQDDDEPAKDNKKNGLQTSFLRAMSEHAVCATLNRSLTRDDARVVIKQRVAAG